MRALTLFLFLFFSTAVVALPIAELRQLISNVFEGEIVPLLESFEESYEDLEAISKRRIEKYDLILHRLDSIDAQSQDAKRIKNYSYGVIESLREEDSRADSILKNQVELLKNNAFDLEKIKNNLNKMQQENEARRKTIEELERRERLYINGLLGTGVAALLAVFTIFSRVPLIGLERHKLKLEIENLKNELSKSGVGHQGATGSGGSV